MRDILEKCSSSPVSIEAKRFMDEGIYPYFRPIESGQGTEVHIKNKPFLMFGSNSYLGLTDDQRVIDASIAAVKQYGTGNAGSRFLNGTLDIHEDLEKKIASLLGKDASLLYSTGYQTNLGVISALVGPGDTVITDKADHASILDGCFLAAGEMKRFCHQDLNHLERVLKKIPRGRGRLIVVDGVYSMEGDIANLPGIIPLAQKYGARLMVDDAHAVGVIGEQGRGTASYWASRGLIDEKDVDIITGTFSKSLASIGGFCACSHEVMHYLRHVSRALIFSASMPPGTVAAVSKSIDIMLEEPERIKQLWTITERARASFRKMGFKMGSSETPIIPLYIGEMEDVFRMWRYITDHGVFVNPVVPPAVSPGACLIRTSYMATHTNEQLDRALEVIENAGKKFGVI